jgi:hypothetical protein
MLLGEAASDTAHITAIAAAISGKPKVLKFMSIPR